MLNLLIVDAGCAALITFYLFHLRSGLRGLVLLLVGCAAIICAYFYVERMFTLLGIVLAAVLLCSALACIAALARANRRKVRYYVPPQARRRSAQVSARRRPAAYDLVD